MLSLLAAAVVLCLESVSVALASQCALTPGVDCLRGDIVARPAKTAEECCNKCQQTSGCTAFTHATGPGQPGGAMCYLKSECNVMVDRVDRTSAIIHGPAPLRLAMEKSELLQANDCVGADIGGGGSFPATSTDECSNMCAATPGCAAFTYKLGAVDWAKAMCYLKFDCVSIVQDPACTSGIMIAPPPGAAPARPTITPGCTMRGGCACDCSWAKTCAADDGTCCWACCCGGYRIPLPAPAPPPPALPPTTRAPPSTQPDEGPAILIQTARDAGDRLTDKGALHFIPDFDFPGTVVDVSSLDTDQTIVGFGGAFTEAAGVVFKSMRADLQEMLLARYFDVDAGIGYTMGRVHINSCDFSLTSWSEDDVDGDLSLVYFDSTLKHDVDAMIPLIKAATQRIHASGRELKLFASPWSPPAWMKTNGLMANGGKLRPDCSASWANYLVKWISAYKAHGIPIWAVTPQNEPMNPASWEACVYTAEEEANWLGDHLGPALDMAHPEVLVLPFDHNKDAVYNWARTMYQHRSASQYTDGIAFHWYSGDSFENVAQVHHDFPQALLLPTEATWEKHRWQPGTTVESGEWSFGEGYAHDIMGDLNAGAAGWTDWNLVLDQSGGPNHLGNYCDAPIMADNTKQEIYVHPQYFFIGHFSKYLLPGSKRIKSHVRGTQRYNGPVRSYGTCTAEDGLQATAFSRPDGKVAVVVLNCADVAVDFKLQDGRRAIRALIPPHAIQTYLFKRAGDLIV